MQFKPSIVIAATVLTLTAAFVIFMWQRGAHVVVDWKWIAAGALLLMFCALKSTLRGGCCRRRGRGEDANSAAATWFLY
jgi:hypothetical protein